MVKLHHQDGIKEGGSPLLTLSNILNYKQATCENDSGILGWAVGVGMEQSCNILLYTIIMERQETTYIEFRVKWHHADGLKEGDSTLLTLPNLLNDIQTVFVSNRFRHFWMSYECWKGANLYFRLYTITLERQVSAYIELMVDYNTKTDLQRVTAPFKTLYYFPNHIQTKFQSDSGILAWAIDSGMDQI